MTAPERTQLPQAVSGFKNLSLSRLNGVKKVVQTVQVYALLGIATKQNCSGAMYENKDKAGRKKNGTKANWHEDLGEGKMPYR